MLAEKIGLPFFFLAAGSPAIQRWSASRQADKGKAYSLYAASNAGSFVALLAYPTLIEPQFSLREQSVLWAVGFALLLGLLGFCASAVLRSPVLIADDATTYAAPPLRVRDPLGWMVLAAVPSSLLLGVTTHITTDLAPIPLLWVIPLALYLLTFVIAFGSWFQGSRRFVDLALPYLTLSVASLLFLRAEIPGASGYALHVVTFFVCALACHLRLFATRPHPARLTEFYLWIAIGGAVGAVFNVLLAPRVFTTVLEYPIALVVAVALARRDEPRVSSWDIAIPSGLAVVLWTSASVHVLSTPFAERLLATAIITTGAIVTFSVRQRSLRFALSLCALLLTGHRFALRQTRFDLRARSFYGVYQVSVDAPTQTRRFYSGTTVHGAELLRDSALTPLTYYHRAGPLGALFSARPWSDSITHVGVVGLGVGSTLAYARENSHWTFYEIDPLVAQIASNTNYFHFLSRAPTRARIVLGDARLSIGREPLASLDLLLVDAFSSDAIPVHLVTKEALDLYRRRLRPGGVIAWHISNRYVDLSPVLEALARNAHLDLVEYDEARLPARADGRFLADWLVMVDPERTEGSFSPWDGWKPVHSKKRSMLWTDDFSNVLDVVR
jgi:hypothetical protein